MPDPRPTPEQVAEAEWEVRRWLDRPHDGPYVMDDVRTVMAELDALRAEHERRAVDMCQVANGATRLREENEAARRLLADERAANEEYRTELAASRRDRLAIVEDTLTLRTEFDRRGAELASARPVVDAARAYIEEVDNPAPDLLLRANLRGRLRDALPAKDAKEGGGDE